MAAVLLYSWNIGYSGLSTYYAASVRAMLANPRAIMFGALDPAVTTTLDKLAGFLVPQALSAKIFGFQAWALSLPQVIEGAITIVASFVIGARWRGPVMGVSVAAVMAFTPMLGAMFGRPMEDGMLTMCVVLAFASWQRALMQRSLLWLCISGAWVAVGFQAKMLQAWLILPALLIAYLACAPLPLRRRIGQIALAGAVTVVLSLSWMTAIQLAPANARPFVDGTTSNNTYSMVFGYNGLDRLLPGAIPGAVPQLNSTPGSGQTPANSTATSQASRNVAKLVLPQFTTQMGWLYPVALAGIVFEWLAWRRSRQRVTTGPERLTEHVRAGTALGLLLWLFITAGVMSAAFVPHATYLAGIALPLSAFAVSGALDARRLLAEASRSWIILPGLILAQTGWAVFVSVTGGIQLRWLAPIIALTGIAAAMVLVVVRMRKVRASNRWYRAGLAGALAATLIGPVVWSLCVLGPGGGGSASDAFAGPRPSASTAHRHEPSIAPGPHLRPPFTTPRSAGLDHEQRLLVSYVTARNHSSSIAFATDTMAVAVSVILFTDENPMPMGGFSQRAPTPALSTLQSLVGSGRLRFVLLADYGKSQQAPGNPTVAADRLWVRRHCAAVLSGHFREGKAARQTLYDCASSASSDSTTG